MDRGSNSKRRLYSRYARTSQNNSNTQLLTISEDDDILATGGSSWLPSSFRKRTISNPEENKSSQPETHELVDLPIQEEQLETQIEVPPK